MDLFLMFTAGVLFGWFFASDVEVKVVDTRRRCSCTYEPGDTGGCPAHPSCCGCGDPLEIEEGVARLHDICPRCWDDGVRP